LDQQTLQNIAAKCRSGTAMFELHSARFNGQMFVIDADHPDKQLD
jgi:hypothetical protein